MTRVYATADGRACIIDLGREPSPATPDEWWAIFCREASESAWELFLSLGVPFLASADISMN